MQSTTDVWDDETFTKWQMANYSNENTTTRAFGRGFQLPFTLTPYRICFTTITVLAVLSNMLVLVGFRLAGRSKMNTSSIHIANHTILELFASANGFLRFVLDMAEMFRAYDASNPGDWIVCMLIETASVASIGSFGSVVCVIIITLDRYWKIVHPIHHRKHYRRWMLKLGLMLPWLNGVAIKLLPVLPTTRIVKGRCVSLTFWAAQVMDDVSLCFCHGSIQQ